MLREGLEVEDQPLSQTQGWEDTSHGVFNIFHQFLVLFPSKGGDKFPSLWMWAELSDWLLTEWGSSDSVWLPRLKDKGHCSSLCALSLKEVSHHVVRRLNGPQAEKWRTPIHSSVSHFGNGSSSPSPAFRWLQAQTTSWLWAQEILQARPIQSQHSWILDPQRL